MGQHTWVIYALLSAMFWGLDYSLSERILKEKISPITLLLVQAICAIIIFSILLKFDQIKHDFQLIISKPKLLVSVLFVIITFNIGNLFIFLSIYEKNATLAGLIELTYPIFTIIFTWLLFKTSYLSPSVIIAAILISAGVLVLSITN